MRHENADMIIAKANDMSLVLLSKTANCWLATSNKLMPVGDEQYYLCRPQHKEACLAWLNGESVQCKNIGLNTWESVGQVDNKKWVKHSVFMSASACIRIKPKKEKRWIAVDVKSNMVVHETYLSKENMMSDFFGCCDGNASGWQLIEIEVEV